MKPNEYDFEIIAGNSGVVKSSRGLVLVFKTDEGEEDFSDTEFIFATEKRRGQQIIKRSSDGAILIEGGKVTIPFSVEDSHILPAGLSTKYSLEAQYGAEQRIRVFGKIKVTRRANID